jgi:hypothetical protein
MNLVGEKIGMRVRKSAIAHDTPELLDRTVFSFAAEQTAEKLDEIYAGAGHDPEGMFGVGVQRRGETRNALTSPEH